MRVSTGQRGQSTEIPFQNQASTGSGAIIPPFGVVLLNGILFYNEGDIIFGANTIGGYGSQYNSFVNGPLEVPPGGYGVCFDPTTPVFAAYEGNLIYHGESWGISSANPYKLQRYVGGFYVISGEDNGLADPDDTGRVLVIRDPMLTFFGKTDSAITKGNAGTVSIWHGQIGFEVDSGDNMTDVYAQFDDVASGKWVQCQARHSVQGSSGARWSITQAEDWPGPQYHP